MTTLSQHAQEGNTSNILIYILLDPRTCSTRYVGITNDMYRRYQEHINCRNENVAKNAWVKDLKQHNFLPVMRVIEAVDTVKQAKLREKYWIAHYASMGEQLFNFECDESEVIAAQPPDLTTTRTAKVGRKFNRDTVKSLILYYLQNKSWPDEIDAEMRGYYERNYIRRSGKYYSKTQEWRREAASQRKQ